MGLLDDFVFSQSALQDYADCPRRFELRYIQEVKWPALQTQSVLDHEAIIEQGQTFHHLLHQHELGIPPQVIEATIRDGGMRLWWTSYLSWQAAHLPSERYPEITLTAALDGKLLMAKYDLIARRADGEFVIVDWKTGKSKRPAYLTSRMQTLVYPFVLASAGDWLNDGAPIPPERIKMTYWFAEDGRAVEIPLSIEKSKTVERLSSLLKEIVMRQEFPQTAEERHCRFCVYRSLCERGEIAGRLDELNEDIDELGGSLSLDFDSLEEIAF
jgi:CRISPR/Cas system-associated exonuclease Cas4 (RecB family)